MTKPKTKRPTCKSLGDRCDYLEGELSRLRAVTSALALKLNTQNSSQEGLPPRTAPKPVLVSEFEELPRKAWWRW